MPPINGVGVGCQRERERRKNWGKWNYAFKDTKGISCDWWTEIIFSGPSALLESFSKESTSKCLWAENEAVVMSGRNLLGAYWYNTQSLTAYISNVQVITTPEEIIGAAMGKHIGVGTECYLNLRERESIIFKLNCCVFYQYMSEKDLILKTVVFLSNLSFNLINILLTHFYFLKCKEYCFQVIV